MKVKDYTVWISRRTGPMPQDVEVKAFRGFRKEDGRAEIINLARKFKNDPGVHVWLAKTPRSLRGR